MQKHQRKQHPEYANTFHLRMLDLRAQVEPFVHTNSARAENLLKRGLTEAMRMWRGELKYDADRPGFWFVKFPDGSEFTPLPEIAKRLRKLAH
jgi:hypothetical protein